MTLKKGEPVLIEHAANGFIINPKDGLLAKVEEDVHVFSEFDRMEEWLRKHFSPKNKEETGRTEE